MTVIRMANTTYSSNRCLLPVSGTVMSGEAFERAHITERPMTFTELTGFGKVKPGEEHDHEHDHGPHAPGGAHEQQQAGST